MHPKKVVSAALVDTLVSGLSALGRPGGLRVGLAVSPKVPSAVDPDGLVARATAGDTTAFRQLYERHRHDVARLVFRMLSGRGDVEDVIQEIFFQAYRSLKDFRGQAKFSTWLHRVAINVVLMHRRAARSRPVYVEEAPQDTAADASTPAPDEDADRRDRMRAFGRLLDRLPEKKRTVFILHELEGIPPVEIAKIVGCPVLTVRTRLFYARRDLEAMLGDEPSLASLDAMPDQANEPRPASQRVTPDFGGAEGK